MKNDFPQVLNGLNFKIMCWINSVLFLILISISSFMVNSLFSKIEHIESIIVTRAERISNIEARLENIEKEVQNIRAKIEPKVVHNSQ